LLTEDKGGPPGVRGTPKKVFLARTGTPQMKRKALVGGGFEGQREKNRAAGKKKTTGEVMKTN